VDDFRLVERMKQGDESAFAALFARHKTAVHRYAAHMGGASGAPADDVVQEVFLAFLRQLAQFDPALGSVQGYLLGIARRQVLRQLGRARLDDAIDSVDAGAACLSADSSAFEDLSRAETVERVREAVGALPPVFREAIVLCELNELDYATAAGIMNCPIGTVRSRLHRARVLLVEALADMRPPSHAPRAPRRQGSPPDARCASARQAVRNTHGR
jgi:RNA polymerase sigma-70 factor (ECF subfamily)